MTHDAASALAVPYRRAGKWAVMAGAWRAFALPAGAASGCVDIGDARVVMPVQTERVAELIGLAWPAGLVRLVPGRPNDQALPTREENR